MIYEKTKQALEKLFLSGDGKPLENVSEAGDSEKTPRPNGILERDYTQCGYHLDVQVAPDQLLEAVAIIDQNNYFIESITGVDWIDDGEIEVVYDFSRYDFDLCRVVIRTRTPRDNGSVPSITDIYTGANWHERETAEFFGITFTGHPHLINLLLPEEADYHPLRKDFKP